MSDRELFEQFGMEDLAPESDNRAGKIVLTCVLGLLWLALAWTTAEFFGEFGSQLGQRFGSMASLFAAGFGLFTVDVAYTAWLYAAKEHATTGAQRIAALTTGVLLFLVSLCVTGVYMSLTASMAQEVLDASALNALKTAGIGILVASTVINGIGLICWNTLGHDWKRASFFTELRAQLLAESQSITSARATMTAQHARTNIKAALPSATEMKGREVGDSYMRGAGLALPAAQPVADQPNELPADTPMPDDGMDDGWGTNGEWMERVYGLSKEEVLTYLREEEKRNAGRFHMSVRWGSDSYAFDLNRELFGDRLAAAVLAARYQNGAPLPPANGRG